MSILKIFKSILYYIYNIHSGTSSCEKLQVLQCYKEVSVWAFLICFEPNFRISCVKDSSFYHVFSPHLIKDQLHQEMSCAICCPASSNRLGCDGAIHLTQKNRGPDVFLMTQKKHAQTIYLHPLKGSNTRSSKWLQQLTTPTFSAMDANTSKAHLVVTKPKAHRVFLVPTWAVEVLQRLDCRLCYVSLTLNILQIIWSIISISQNHSYIDKILDMVLLSINSLSRF